LNHGDQTELKLSLLIYFKTHRESWKDITNKIKGLVIKLFEENDSFSYDVHFIKFLFMALGESEVQHPKKQDTI
jgi:hypothetical protein